MLLVNEWGNYKYCALMNLYLKEKLARLGKKHSKTFQRRQRLVGACVPPSIFFPTSNIPCLPSPLTPAESGGERDNLSQRTWPSVPHQRYAGNLAKISPFKPQPYKSSVF